MPARRQASPAGRVALVSGAGQGLGRAIARRLAADGARVAVNDREPSAAVDEVVAETGGLAAIADVADAEAVAHMVRGVEARAGTVEVLVANHAYMSMAPFVDHEPAAGGATSRSTCRAPSISCTPSSAACAGSDGDGS
jgi:NAD(P)-dependent dehydrogenase (short-subunit alcohol dehydrogenase family)